MEKRSLFVAARLIALLALSCSALAAGREPGPEQQADWQQRLEQASALQAEAKVRQATADQLFEQKSAACFKKFLVNACQQEARREQVTAAKEARRLENEGKALERAVKKEQLSDKDRRHAAAMPERAAERQQREAEVSAERETAAARQAATRASKARQADERSQQRAAEAAAQRQKQAAHDARVATQVKEAERRAAEAGNVKK